MHNELTVWLEYFFKGQKSESCFRGLCFGMERGCKWCPSRICTRSTLIRLVYINDLLEVVANNMKLYVDDSKIIAIVDIIIERKGLQKDLNSISVWMREWKMKLNVAKCKVEHFGRSNLETNNQIQDEYFNYKIL